MHIKPMYACVRACTKPVRWMTGIQFLAGAIKGFFFSHFITAYKQTLGPTQSPIQHVLGVLSSSKVAWA